MVGAVEPAVSPGDGAAYRSIAMRFFTFTIIAIGLFGLMPSGPANGAECKEGRISCGEWCKKYREPQNQVSCLRVGPKSCINRYGSLDVCIPDRERP